MNTISQLQNDLDQLRVAFEAVGNTRELDCNKLLNGPDEAYEFVEDR